MQFDGRRSSPQRFYEPLKARFSRWAFGAAYALQPKRIGLLPRLTIDTITNTLRPIRNIDALLQKQNFHRDEGYLGICNDVSAESILKAYRQSVYPVTHLGPMKWWSPAERAVLFFDDAKVEKSVRKTVRQDILDVTFDRDFAAVLEACARPRHGRLPLTWLTPRMMNAFWDLHLAGHAHSIEVWDLRPQLVGGIFGVTIGGVFFGESQFSTANNASKVASLYLNRHLAHWGFAVRDAKSMTPYIASLGFKNIPRSRFQQLLDSHLNQPRGPACWEVDETLSVLK
jgi:leucyl/phenylalanyl-tRNA--protein transferase